MSALSWILLSTLAGGALSVLCAGALALKVRASIVPVLISYAIGAMLGAVFLEILPEALERTKSHETLTLTVLIGILLFFLLEKLVLWRHCHHGDDCEAHGAPAHGHGHAHAQAAAHDHGRSGLMVMAGNMFHNFVDGILIGAAFLADIKLGVVTSLAIIAHEIPQEVGDFLVLIHSGYSKRQALLFNLGASLATLTGGLLSYAALQGLAAIVPICLGLAAASMIYVAVADLIPGLHKRTELRATVQQMVLIAAGVSSIWLVQMLIAER